MPRLLNQRSQPFESCEAPSTKRQKHARRHPLGGSEVRKPSIGAEVMTPAVSRVYGPSMFAADPRFRPCPTSPEHEFEAYSNR
jgi:hypothetical protein